MAKITKHKQCSFCKKHIQEIDFKDVSLLQKYLSSWAKLKGMRETGNCAKHQRRLALAVKRARFMALLSFTSR